MKSHGLEMYGPISSEDGVEAITVDEGTGKVTFLTDVEVDGTAQLDGTVKITGASPASGKILVTTDSVGTLSWAYQSVPSGKTVLFEKDTAVLGYTVETGFDDGVVYITKGSAAGGETGGTNVSGGTWTQPSHDHGGPTAYTGYTAISWSNMPPHYHGAPYNSWFCNYGYGEHGESGDIHWIMSRTGYVGGTYTGGPAAGHRHTLSGSIVAAIPPTWKPYGRNFTRQTKS